MICSYQQIEMVHKTEPIGLQRYWVGGIKVISFLLTFALWLSKLCWNTEHHHQITLNPLNLKWVRWFPKYVYIFISKRYCKQHPFYQDWIWDKQESNNGPIQHHCSLCFITRVWSKYVCVFIISSQFTAGNLHLYCENFLLTQ